MSSPLTSHHYLKNICGSILGARRLRLEGNSARNPDRTLWSRPRCCRHSTIATSPFVHCESGFRRCRRLLLRDARRVPVGVLCCRSSRTKPGTRPTPPSLHLSKRAIKDNEPATAVQSAPSTDLEFSPAQEVDVWTRAPPLRKPRDPARDQTATGTLWRPRSSLWSRCHRYAESLLDNGQRAT